MQQMGVGLGVAVLIDATIVRSVLLPASMKLLGDRNWYLPKWLDWLPKANNGEGGSEAAHPAKRLGERVILGQPAPVPVPARTSGPRPEVDPKIRTGG